MKDHAINGVAMRCILFNIWSLLNAPEGEVALQ